MSKKKRRQIDRPKVLSWYVAYCVFLSLTGIFFIITGILVSQTDPVHLAELREDVDIFPLPFYLGLGILSLIMSVLGIFMPRKPRFWKWIYGLVLICIAMPSCCYLPVTIPLLIFWVQSETREYFKQSHTEPSQSKKN